MVTAEQMALITRQLGRTPRGIAGIARMTEAGVPVVLQMRSLVEDKPFPTLYWLSSRDLYQVIAEIETAGWIKQAESRIADDPALQQALYSDHQAYVAERWRLMVAEDRERIATLGFSDLFEQYGIGGIAQWDKVRCLHMHYAWHLCRPAGTLVGRWLDEEFHLQELAIRQ